MTSHATAADEASVPDTLISLIVAFVIAMAFRGFVVEGFVIPTGSMAPTLLGEHVLWRSPLTGYEFATDTSEAPGGGNPGVSPRASYDVYDPMLGVEHRFTTNEWNDLRALTRPGDRVLVMKWLYNFIDPNRWDVMVFKNPTDVRENYIKRLIGLPGETIWLADGDVFVRPAAEDGAPFVIQRKPDHVQRAVWRPVYHSEWIPVEGADVRHNFTTPWEGHGWKTQGTRSYRCDTEEPTTLWWNNRLHPLTETNAFNMFRRRKPEYNVADVRVAARVTPDSAGLHTTLRLQARLHEFEFIIERDRASIRMREAALDAVGRPPSADRAWDREASVSIDPLPAGRASEIEFWHVDQRLRLFINGRDVCSLSYEWDPFDRLRFATGKEVDRTLQTSHSKHPWVHEAAPTEAVLEWDFSGSPLTLHEVQVDRDLYYRPDWRDERRVLPAMGTHPNHLATTAEDQFFMLGDNSAESNDGRMWGEPDPLIAQQIDHSQFLVNRQLIVGRAWCVYFPAPFELKEGGARIIPDFGRMRFIR